MTAPAYRWRLLALLTLVYASHAMDRIAVAVVLEPVKADFGLSDAEAGALGGLAYGAAFCLFVLPLGWLADRINRRRLLAVLVAAWSGFTLLAGMASQLWMMLLARVGVGAAEAGGSPVSMSLLSDVFPPERRPLAVGVLYLGLALGQGAIFLLGGAVAAEWGWRAAFLVAGAPGVLIALLVWMMVRDIPRSTAGEASPAAPLTPAATLRRLAASPSLLLVTLGATCCSVATSVIWAWTPALFMRTHALDIGTAGLVFSIATALCSGLGSLVAGPIADRVARGGIDRLGWLSAAIALTATPLGLGMICNDDLHAAVAGVLVLGFLLGAWLPPTFGLALAIAPAEARASAMALIQFSASLFAGALAPFLVGLLSDSFGGEDSLARALGVVFPVMGVAALAFAGASLLLGRCSGGSGARGALRPGT